MSSNFEEVKSKANIKNVLHDGLELNTKESGNEFKTDCPFEKHSKSKNPFSINQTTGAWTCFACEDKKSGPHIINLVEKIKKFSFPEAIKYVEKYSNITTNSFQPTLKISKTTQKKEPSYSPQNVINSWNNAIYFSNDLLKKEDTYFRYKKLTPPNNAKFGQNPYNHKSTLMPFQDIHGTFKGFICLSQSGKYNFITDDSIKFMLLGQLKNDDCFYIGEGIATVQTVWEATNQIYPAIAVGGWHNMLPTLQEITSNYPNLTPIVLLDLDKKNKTTEIINVNSKAICISPRFKTTDQKLKDFNDLLSKEGHTMETIQEQVENAIQVIHEKTKIIEAAQKTELKEEEKLITADLLIQDQEDRLAKYKGKDFLGIPQKTIPTLDKMLSGLRKYILLSAGPNVGKTALVIQLAIDTIQNNTNVCAIFLSLEMSREEILDRIKCYLAKITYNTLCFGSIKNKNNEWYSKEEQTRLDNANKIMETICKRLLILDEKNDSNITTEKILDYISKLKKQTNCQRVICVIDYLQLFPIPKNSKFHSDLGEDKYRVSQIKKLTHALEDDPLIVISESKKPSGTEKWGGNLSDIMGSSRIAYSGNAITFLNNISDEELEEIIKKTKIKNTIDSSSIQEELSKKGQVITKFTIAKGRDGMQKGHIVLLYHFFENRFEETTIEKIIKDLNSPQKNNNEQDLNNNESQPDYQSAFFKK